MGNDIADINLMLKSNEKFKPIDAISVSFKGNWKVEKEKYVLTFNRKSIDFNSLFPKYDGIEVISENKIQFNSSFDGLWIWGIYCYKSGTQND
ncbi:MAG: hypothetical protein ACJATA_000695 [Sphingobacteriales bacterium]|jgi:hypothetical protein